MTEITVAAKKFLHLLDYIQRIGLSSRKIAGSVHLLPERLAELPEEQGLPAQLYSRLYRAAVKEMQTLGQPLPWAAGLGSEAFELMCHTVISCKTLGDALQMAGRFDALLYPIQHFGMTIKEDESGKIKLCFNTSIVDENSKLIPSEWERAEFQSTVSHASGLLVWRGFCGWLTGQPLDVARVSIAAPYLNKAYEESLSQSFNSPVQFDEQENMFEFSAEHLSRRIIQTVDALDDFFNELIYQLIIAQQQPASTSSAIKSLLIIDISRGALSFERISESLYMSESSLRRRLKQEGTSYQELKDEVRCDIAINMLLNEDAKLADIADYLKFSEASSFVRSFRSWTGYTPKAYKERMEKLGSF